MCRWVIIESAFVRLCVRVCVCACACVLVCAQVDSSPGETGLGVHLLLTTGSDGDLAPPLAVVGVGSDVHKEPFLAVPVDGLGKTVGGKLIPGGVAVVHNSGKDADGQSAWERAHLWHRKNIVHPWVQQKLRVLHGDAAVDAILAGGKNPCVFGFCKRACSHPAHVPVQSFTTSFSLTFLFCCCDLRWVCSRTQSPCHEPFCGRRRGAAARTHVCVCSPPSAVFTCALRRAARRTAVRTLS